MTLELKMDMNRWINHGRPPGGDVAAIADASTIRPDVVFTVRYAAFVLSKVFKANLILNRAWTN